MQKTNFITNQHELDNLVPDPKSREHRCEIHYGKGGNEVDESASLAKMFIVGKWEKFFIWFQRNTMYDPYYGGTILKRFDASTKFEIVDNQVFHLYVKYLKTKNISFYNRARRLHDQNKRGK